MGGISIWQLLIVLLIVIVLFGTKKLRNMGGDLGAAIRNFKKSVKEGEDEAKGGEEKLEDSSGRVIEGEVKARQRDKA